VRVVFEWRKNYDFPSASRHNRKPLLSRDNIGQRPKDSAQSPEFDSQACAISFIGTFRSECLRDESLPRHICRPRFGEQPRERE
jgi:hypothetical protein